MNVRAASGTLPPRLDPLGVYRTPTGRLCVVRDVDYHEPLLRNGAAVAHLDYMRPDGRVVASHMAEGFSLARENWSLRKLVGQRPAVAQGVR